MVLSCQDSDQARANVGNGVGQGDFTAVTTRIGLNQHKSLSFFYKLLKLLILYRNDPDVSSCLLQLIYGTLDRRTRIMTLTVLIILGTFPDDMSHSYTNIAQRVTIVRVK